MTPFGVSSGGNQVLVQLGGFEGPPSSGSVAVMPWAGGTPTVLVKHAGDPSWNR